MYIFKTEMPVKINQSKACEIIGLAQPTLSNKHEQPQIINAV